MPESLTGTREPFVSDLANPTSLAFVSKLNSLCRMSTEREMAALDAIDTLQRGETVEWIVEDKASLVLRRQKVPPSAMKKNGRNDRRLQSVVRPGQACLYAGSNV